MSIPRQIPKRVYFGVFLTGASILMLEVVLTRILSVILLYHFAFLVVSLALLGIGLGGLVLYLLPRVFPSEKIFHRLSQSALAFSATTISMLLLICFFDLETPYLILVFCLIAFFFGGLTLSLALSAFSEHVSRLYFADLTGSGLGCLAVIGLMSLLPAPSVVLVIAAAASAAAWLFCFPQESNRRRFSRFALWLGFGCVSLAIINSVSPLIVVDYARRDLEAQVNEYVEYDKWNAFSRVVVFSRENTDIKKILIDSGAMTTITQFRGNPNELTKLKEKFYSLPYQLKSNQRVLALGPGGGLDILIALAFGSTDVTGVEINPIIVNDLIKNIYRDYSGDLYRYPGVRLVVDEARSFLERDKNSYDLIQNTFVDTWAASAAGAYSLSENNLYTVEAFQTYFNRLTPDGIIAITRWWTEPPRETLRVVSLGLEAFRRLGVSDPARHIVVIGKRAVEGQNQHAAVLLFKKSAFTPQEIERATAFADQQRFEIIYTPTQSNDQLTSALITAGDPRAFERGYQLDITPTTDNRPFFFFMLRLRDVFDRQKSEIPLELEGIYKSTQNLMITFMAIIVTLLIFILLPFFRFRKRQPAGAHSGKALAYFILLGLSFMTVEVYFMQRFVLFLGHPVYALSVILFVLLLSGGLGSSLTNRIPIDFQIRYLRRFLASLVLLLGLSAAILPIEFNVFIQSSQIFRIALSMLLIAPVGVLMGTALPLGLKIFTQKQPGLIPWLWGINGAASVLGSVAAFLVAINLGYLQTVLAGAGLYFLTLLLVLKLKPASEKYLR